MATIEIPNVRQESTVLMPTTLKDNGVAVDWSGLQNIKAYMYSDAQRVIAGKCDVEVDGEDATVLKVTYAATRPQYLGVNSLLVRCKYHGREKSYDVPVLNFVERTAQATGVTELDDPVIDVEIEVDEVSTSLLDGAIAAALDAAVKAEEAASLVPLQVLEDCVEATENAETATAAANEAAAAAHAAGITSVQASIADNEPGTPSAEATLLNKVLSLVFHHLKGDKGDTGATPDISVGTVTTGAPGTPVVVTMTGTAAAPVLNITIPQGLKGDKGDQGNTGSSVEFPYELVNNLTTNDPTKGLSAAQGVVLDGKISQLDQKVSESPVTFAENKTIAIGGTIGATVSLVQSTENGWKSAIVPCQPGDKFVLSGKGGYSTRLWGFVDADNKLIAVSASSLTESGVTLVAPSNSANALFNINGNGSCTYLSVNSVRGEINGLEGDLEDLSEDMTVQTTLPMSPTQKSDIRLDTTKVVAASGAALYYVPIKKGQTIRASWAFSSSSVQYATTEMEPTKETVVSDFGSGGTGTTGHDFTASKDGYVVVSFSAGPPSSISFARLNNAIGGIVRQMQDTIPSRAVIPGNGGTAVTTEVALPSGHRYIAKIENFVRGVDTQGYLIFRIKTGSRTICQYYGPDIVPDKISFELGTEETGVTLYTRVESSRICSVIFEQTDNPGIFDFNDYGLELLRIENAKKKLASSGSVPFVMLHFSDIHADTVRLKRILDYYNAMGVRVDEIIHTGDSVEDTVTATSFDFWDACNARKVLNCLGNHDVWYTDAFTPPANYPYNTYIKPYVDGGYWGTVVQPDNAEANGLCYYYKDYANGIRLVVLDYVTTADQISWFAGVLADAITNNLAVVVAAHYPVELTTPFDTAFDITPWNNLDQWLADSFINAVDTFISNGGEFVCWLTGHTHRDFCGVREISGRKQVAICIDCAALRNDSPFRYRAEQTKSQDTFNLVAVNPNKKLISVWRVGNELDALNRRKGSMCINYATGELVYTD